MRLSKGWSSHMPMLLKAVQLTDKPVMEVGAGIYSTPLLHWLCFEKNKLVTYERDEEFYLYAKQFQSRRHSIRRVESYDEIKTDKRWGVIFIDHEADRRSVDVIRLKNNADYIVIHDTHSDYYGYDKIWEHFKYIYHWKKSLPWTSVVSNFKRVDKWN